MTAGRTEEFADDESIEKTVTKRKTEPQNCKIAQEEYAEEYENLVMSTIVFLQ